jgi:hypothetical protein
MSVPFDPVVPPPSIPPLTPPDPDRIPGEEPPPDREPDERGRWGPQFRPLPDVGASLPGRQAAVGGRPVSEDWKESLRLKLEEIVDQAVVEGARQADASTRSSRRSEW